jgi:hypothetical protein
MENSNALAMKVIRYDRTLHVLDNHCHILSPEPITETCAKYTQVFERAAISEAGMVSCGAPGHREHDIFLLENLETLYLKDCLEIPIFAYASFTEYWDDPQKYKEFAKLMLEMGFDGFKSMDEHPNNRKNLGKGLPHPSFAGFFEVLDETKSPILCHVGDPRPNWSTETAYSWVASYGRLYGDDFLSLDELYEETEEVIARYPNIPFILAHFYFISDNYERACSLLENNPNIYFERITTK